MINIDQLNEQNHEIAELTKVLNHVMKYREDCDTSVINDLFFKYIEKVTAHLQTVEKEVYHLMLAHKDNDVRNTANRFMSGSSEIKRIFKQYQRRWCRHNMLYINDHDKFLKDSNEMFELILKRITDEAENLYPLVRVIMVEKS